ncbi:exopolyphosphatase [bacterium]|nr:exopolyphosphatase [bacterium]
MRLLTRSDFDGLVCAVFLTELGIVDEYKFVHPKDIQTDSVEVTSDDVLANVPYHPKCGMWFDHHVSEEDRVQIKNLDFKGASYVADSAAHVIWEYYGKEEAFGDKFDDLLNAVDKVDSAKLSKDEILHAKSWILLSFIMDPRTGLGYFKDFRISNYQLMLDMIQYCRTKDVDEILDIQDVKERADLYFEQQELFEDMLKRCCQVRKNVIVTNLLNEETIYCGNRFLVYGIFSEQNIEVRIQWGKNKQNVVFACGHSVINTSSKTHVGKLMLKYGGGGHERVGTCQIETDKWQEILEEIITKMQQDG